MAKDTRLKFKLKGRVATSVSWELPLKTVFIRKPDGQGNYGSPKKIQYVPGEDSAFVEDHKGDQEPMKIVFEQGVFKASAHDKALLHILFNHPWYGEYYERDDENVQAKKKLGDYELIEKALEKVSIANEEEAKAAAIVILGPEAISYTDVKVRAELKERAFTQADKVLEIMSNNDYQSRWVAALAIMRGAILVNPTKTAVTWPDGKVIVRVASGQDPIDKLGFFLSDNTDEAKTTLQEIGEKVKRSYVKKVETLDTETFKQAIPDAEEEEEEEETIDVGIKEARNLYKEKFDKAVPHNMKNNKEWILNKLGTE